MVNTGRPSEACKQCRARRIKCDSTRPHCERCIKYGVTCPGYPEKSLVFRDVTLAIHDRAVKKYEKKRRDKISQGRARSPVVRVKTLVEAELESKITPSPSPSATESTASKALIPSPAYQPDSTALVDAAVAGFLSQWENANVDVWWSALDMATVRSSRLTSNSTLTAALHAASLMALALRPELQYRDLKSLAAGMYGKALRTLNQSLLDLKQSLEDTTITAVMLTTLFENMCEEIDSNPAMTHIRGMMSMINARGSKQFHSLVGRRIFLYAYFNWTATAMPDIAAMPHMAPAFGPPLCEGIIDALLEHDFGAQEPCFRLIPLIHRSLMLRTSSMSVIQSTSNRFDIHSIMSEIDMLDHGLLAWNNLLPPRWGEQDHLYQMLTTSWFRTHRIFLADLSIRCHQRLAELDGENHDRDIWWHVDAAQNAIDHICVRIPYSFGADNPRKRKPLIQPRVVPDAKITYLYHASFEYPLLVASMVWTLPPFRQRGIETARMQCANTCGLERPRRKYPKVLVYLTPDERARYVRFRIERAQWLAAEESNG